jgi:hypothetical protein
MSQFLYLCLLLVLPAFLAFEFRRRRRLGPDVVMAGFALLVLTGWGILAGWPIAPFGKNIVTVIGVAIGPQDASEASHVILPSWFRIALTGVINGIAVSTAVYLFTRARRLTMGRLTTDKYRTAVAVFLVFSLSYGVLLLPGALLEVVFDRYVLPLLPLFFLAVMIAVKHRKPHIPARAWICLLVFGIYAVATTHDYFAGLRARVDAARTMEKSGIGPSHISAAFESDGWGQLERTGYATGARYSDQFASDAHKGFWFELWNHFVDLRPDFVVLNWVRPEPPHDVEGIVAYTAWTPPFRRQVVVWKRSVLTDELEEARLISETRLWR